MAGRRDPARGQDDGIEISRAARGRCAKSCGHLLENCRSQILGRRHVGEGPCVELLRGRVRILLFALRFASLHQWGWSLFLCLLQESGIAGRVRLRAQAPVLGGQHPAAEECNWYRELASAGASLC